MIEAPAPSDPATSPVPAPASSAPSIAEWKALVAKYQTPSLPKAIWQIVNTFVPYAALWVAMYFTLSISWWLTIPIAVLAGLFVVRIFIIFHDCGHGSFFKSRTANDVLGFISGLITFTPYYHWRWEHSIHHATAGDLDRRGKGDIWTMTVQEYLETTRWRRFAYRMARNPLILFLVAPLYLFLIRERLPSPGAKRREHLSVWWMNAAIACMVVGMGFTFGWLNYVILQLTVTLVAGASGIWLFYVQHQFEDVYWERGPEWDYTVAALQGSSFYQLPRVLQWFSGNIGFHHIHHLSPRIPNYNLEQCHESHPYFSSVKPLTVRQSLKALAYRLWDEPKRKLVGFRQIRHLPRTGPPQAAGKE